MRNDESKINQVFNKYYAYLIFYANKMLNSQSLAEDMVQEVFYRLIKRNNLDKIEDVNSSKTRNFLITILINVCLTHLEKMGKYKNIPFDEAFLFPKQSNDPTWENYLMNNACDKIKIEISKLQRKDKLLLVLLHLDYSYIQIAEILDVSTNYVATRISRIMKKLKKGLH